MIKAQPGSVSVVRMEGGYTIVALVAKQAGRPARPQHARSARRHHGRRCGADAKQLLRTAYVETIRNKATVVNHIARRIVESQGKLPPALAPTAPK